MSTWSCPMVSMNQGWCLHRTRMCLSEEKKIAGPNRITKCIRWRPKSIVAVPTTNGDGWPTPPYLSPIWTRLSFGPRWRISEWGGITITALRSWINTHFPFFSATMAMSLACLSYACWVLVRSTSRKILYMSGSEFNLLLSRRVLDQSSGVQKWKNIVELSPTHARLEWGPSSPRFHEGRKCQYKGGSLTSSWEVGVLALSG